MASTSFTRFKIPAYANIDAECPEVTTHSIYTEDCSTLSNDFVGAASLTVSGGFFYAELKDMVTQKTYKFCLRVSTSKNHIEVQNLEYIVCTASTIQPSEVFVQK